VAIGRAIPTRVAITFYSVMFDATGVEVLATLQDFSETDGIWIGAGFFSGQVKQYACCQGGYPDIVDVSAGEFRIEFR
jgi:hypothetical protein